MRRLFLIVGLAGVLGFTAACGRDPLDAGIRALEGGNAAKAETLLDRAAKLRPADASAWANLGLARLRLGRADEAVAAFRQAAELDHDDARPLEFIASVQAERGQWKPALDTLNEALRRDAKSPRLLTALAMAELHIYGPQTARSRLADVLTLAPNYSPAVFNLAVVTREGLNDPAEANKLLHRYLKIAPGDPHASEARAALGDSAAAEPPQSATDLPGTVRAPAPSPAAGAPTAPRQATTPRNPQAAAEAYNRGVRCQVAGDMDRAVQEYSRALQCDPTMANAHYNIGLIYKSKGDAAGARTAFQHALEIAPDMANAHYMLALAYRDQGDDVHAAAELSTLLQKQPRHAEAYLALGLIHRKNPDTVALARRELTRYLELAPNGASARDVRSWLKRSR